MNTEIKLFVLTKHLEALHDTREHLKLHLTRLFDGGRVPPSYFDTWLKRYDTLVASRDTQIMILRELGLTFRAIQSALHCSPSTIQRVLSKYSLNYQELEATYTIAPQMEVVEDKLRKAGTSLW